MYRYHKPVKLKVFTRVEQFISNEIGYLTPNLEWSGNHYGTVPALQIDAEISAGPMMIGLYR